MGYNNYGLFLEIFVNKSQTQNSLILFSLFKFLNTTLLIFYIQFTPSFLLDVQRYIYILYIGLFMVGSIVYQPIRPDQLTL